MTVPKAAEAIGPPRLHANGGRRLAETVEDPVCGTELRPEDAVATEVHDGNKLYFESEECHRTYLNDPHRNGHGEYEEDPGVGE